MENQWMSNCSRKITVLRKKIIKKRLKYILHLEVKIKYKERGEMKLMKIKGLMKMMMMK